MKQSYILFLSLLFLFNINCGSSVNDLDECYFVEEVDSHSGWHQLIKVINKGSFFEVNLPRRRILEFRVKPEIILPTGETLLPIHIMSSVDGFKGSRHLKLLAKLMRVGRVTLVEGCVIRDHDD